MKPAACILALALVALVAACSEARDPTEPCDACEVRIHPVGILDPASDAFHGRELARRGYDFAICARCHGEAFDGGAAKVSCLKCHQAGPTACVTCHRDGPTTNAHLAHKAKGLACATCHVVPASWDAPGHIVGDITPKPEVVLTTGTWDGATCTNASCHGTARPRWDTASTGACGTCHGIPPASHVRSDCATCHPATAPHVDGVVQIGTQPGCNGCHDQSSGAHQAHLTGRTRLAAPIACATCHVVPTTIASVGHIDSIGPAEVVAAVGWDHDAQTCANTCHGPAHPPWTSMGEVICGSCHGIPPATAAHVTATSLSTCTTCHPRTVDGFGGIIINNGSSEHIDGDVDLQ
ncbi:MAG: hypothetical protein NT062_32045 [Proteobacteria bacterium]|nr:hypothetical protein [Pseudomonadota bacterium]